MDDVEDAVNPYLGLFDAPSHAAQREKRYAQVKSEIPQWNDFPWWQMHTEHLEGVPLKHVVSEYFTHNKPIVNFDGTQSVPVYADFMRQGGNDNITTVKDDPWPKEWTDWSQRPEPDQLPLKRVTQLDLINVNKTPAPLQPARTEQLVTITSYMISNTHFICHMSCQGRNYRCADCFNTELLYDVR